MSLDLAPPRKTASRTRAVVSRNTDVFAVVTFAYLVAYLFAIGDLSLAPGGGFTVGVGDLSNAFRRSSAFYFEPIASVAVGSVFLLVSVGNLVVGGAISARVGANLTFTYVSLRQPSACERRNTAGLLSAIPALTAGTACCAPAVFLALGVQATSGLLALQTAALPVAVLLLVLSLSSVASDG